MDTHRGRHKACPYSGGAGGPAWRDAIRLADPTLPEMPNPTCAAPAERLLGNGRWGAKHPISDPNQHPEKIVDHHDHENTRPAHNDRHG